MPLSALTEEAAGDASLDALVELGFARQDCAQALAFAEGNVDTAAAILLSAC